MQLSNAGNVSLKFLSRLTNMLHASDHMMAMKMIDQAHAKGGKIRSFTSYCGGLPSPSSANNPLAYKFRYSLKFLLRTYLLILIC